MVSKKKIESEIKYYYPERSVEDHAQTNTMKRRLELVLDEIIDGVSKEEQIATIDLRLLRYATVIDYGEYERTSDVAFEQGCLSIQEQLHKDPKTMSVMEYMAATKMLEERSRKLEQIQNKHKK